MQTVVSGVWPPGSFPAPHLCRGQGAHPVWPSPSMSSLKAKLSTHPNQNIYSFCNALTKLCTINKQDVCLLNGQESLFRK